MEEAQQSTVFDSDQQLIGEAYANALVNFGQQQGTTETLLSELDEVAGVLRQLPKLAAMLQSPSIGLAEKSNLLEKAFAGKVDKHLLNFLKVVLEKGRADCIVAINRAARAIYDELSGRVQATMTTAEAVEQSVCDSVQQQLSEKFGREIQLVTKVDPTVIGGMVVRIGDTVYDSSVKSQLNQVRAAAIKSTSDAIRTSLDKFMAG